MSHKKNLKYIISGSILFLLVYIFVAAIPMGKDVYFEPVWTKDISTVPDATVTDRQPFSSDKKFEAFILGNRFGYFTPDGTILSSTQTDERISVSSNAWTVYPQDAHDTVIYYPDGSEKMTIPESGFVYLNNNRTYLFLPGGEGVSQYANDGSILWTREHTAPITAFNSSAAGTIIGYADGQIVCLKPDGTEVFDFNPGGSKYQVILGVALSENGKMAACVSGIDNQRFILIRIASNGQYKIIFHTYLEGNLHRQAFVDFEKNGKYAFFEADKTLGIVDCTHLTASRIPIQGQIVAAGECPGEALFVVLIKNDTTYTLAAIERPDHLIASTSFTAHNAFLIQREQVIYLGTDDSISRIDIRGLQ